MPSYPLPAPRIEKRSNAVNFVKRSLPPRSGSRLQVEWNCVQMEPSILNKYLSTKRNENYVVFCIRQEELMKIFSILSSHKYFPNFSRRAKENIYLNFPLVHSWRSALSDSHWQIISEGKICADFAQIFTVCMYVPIGVERTIHTSHGGTWRTMHCRLCINCYGTG